MNVEFSITYCAAVVLRHGTVRETAFTNAAVADAATQDLAARVRVRAVPGLDETRARVVVQLAGGRGREAATDLRADGAPDLIQAELLAKFRELVAPRLGPDATARLSAAIATLDDLDDVRELTRIGARADDGDTTALEQPVEGRDRA